MIVKLGSPVRWSRVRLSKISSLVSIPERIKRRDSAAYVTNASIALSTLGDSALSIPIEKRDTIYSSDSQSQPNSRSVGIGTALLLLCAHSIHPPVFGDLYLETHLRKENGSFIE